MRTRTTLTRIDAEALTGPMWPPLAGLPVTCSPSSNVSGLLWALPLSGLLWTGVGLLLSQLL